MIHQLKVGGETLAVYVTEANPGCEGFADTFKWHATVPVYGLSKFGRTEQEVLEKIRAAIGDFQAFTSNDEGIL